MKLGKFSVILILLPELGRKPSDCVKLMLKWLHRKRGIESWLVDHGKSVPLSPAFKPLLGGGGHLLLLI